MTPSQTYSSSENKENHNRGRKERRKFGFPVSVISIDFDDFFSVYSLVFVSIEKIYQTLEIVLHRVSKHLDFGQIYPAAVFGYPDAFLNMRLCYVAVIT